MPVGAGIMVGGSIVSGLIKSHQASKAADAQKAAADQALATQNEMRAQTRADLAPYTGTGAAAFGKLGDFLGLPKSPTPGTTQAATPPGAMPAAGTKGFGYNVSKSVSPTGQLFQQGNGTWGPTGPGTANPGTASSYVMLRAPDGTTKQVPADQEAGYIAKGAQRV